MAGQKISQFTVISALASADYFPVIQNSDTSNKRIPVSQLFSSVPTGSASTPSLAFIGDTNTGIYSPGADQVSVATGGTERLRIDSTGQIESVSLGAAAAPAYTWVGDPNTGIYSPGADQVAISTNGTGRLFVDASGNVGVGVSSPATASFGNTIRNKAPVGTGAAGYFTEGANSDTWFGIYSGTGTSDSAALIYPSTGSLRIATSTGVGNGGFSEKLRLDSSGRLLVGTSTARTYSAYGIAGIQNEATAFAKASLGLTNNQNTTDGVALMLGKTRGAAVGDNTIVASGDTLGVVHFQGADGTALRAAATIAAVVDGTPGANDMPGRLVFSTTADGASSPTERMRITSDAYVRLAAGTGGIQFNGDTAAANALDDYEEGTWTPTIAGTTSAGTGTYTLQQGNYTKIGNTVSIQGYVVWTAHTGTGNLNITSLPFTSNSATYYRAPVSLGYFRDIETTLGIQQVTAQIGQNATIINFWQTPDGGGNPTNIPIDTAGYISFSAVYIV